MFVVWRVEKSPAHVIAGLKGELPGMGMLTAKQTEPDKISSISFYT